MLHGPADRRPQDLPNLYLQPSHTLAERQEGYRMSALKDAGTCTSCGAVSEQWFKGGPCPECWQRQSVGFGTAQAFSEAHGGKSLTKDD